MIHLPNLQIQSVKFITCMNPQDRKDSNRVIHIENLNTVDPIDGQEWETGDWSVTVTPHGTLCICSGMKEDSITA